MSNESTVHEIQVTALQGYGACYRSGNCWGWTLDGGPGLPSGQIVQVSLGTHKVCTHYATTSILASCSSCYTCIINGTNPIACTWIRTASHGNGPCGFHIVELE